MSAARSVALIAWLAAACARSPQPVVAAAATRRQLRPAQVTDSAIALGRAVFLGRGNCRHCHGNDGRGTALGPDLGDDVWIHGDGSYGSLIERVVHGVPAPRDSARLPMPEREVADLRYPDISAVAAYVWSLREGRR